MRPVALVALLLAAMMPAAEPSRGVVVNLAVEDAGTDRIYIALESIDAHKYLVREGSGDFVREVWVDTAGRLLKVTIPSRQLVAVRDDAPRTSPR